jgi:hypothetical protein
LKTLLLPQKEVIKYVPVLYDAQDGELINLYKWHLWQRKGSSSPMYAITKNNLSMHRLIIQAPRGVQIDHINGDGLDNRRANLRLASSAENGRNRRKTRGSSQYKGVCWHKIRNCWVAYICIDGTHTHLGVFQNETEAAKKYNEVALKIYGVFAKLNKI